MYYQIKVGYMYESSIIILQYSLVLDILCVTYFLTSITICLTRRYVRYG